MVKERKAGSWWLWALICFAAFQGLGLCVILLAPAYNRMEEQHYKDVKASEEAENRRLDELAYHVNSYMRTYVRPAGWEHRPKRYAPRGKIFAYVTEKRGWRHYDRFPLSVNDLLPKDVKAERPENAQTIVLITLEWNSTKTTITTYHGVEDRRDTKEEARYDVTCQAFDRESGDTIEGLPYSLYTTPLEDLSRILADWARGRRDGT